MQKALPLVLGFASCLMLLASQTGCASDRAHERFKSMMQDQVGKGKDDPNAYIRRYPEMHVDSRELSNGNREEHLRMGIAWRCHVYFEIDKLSQQIVGWRYEGTKDVCAHSR